MRKYVIIGSGAAGIAASEEIRRHDSQASIQIITNDKNGYYSRPGVAYYLSGNINRDQLFPMSPAHFKKQNIHFLYENVLRIDTSGHNLNLDSGRVMPYDRLLVAVGASAMRSDLPGADLNGVVKMDDIEDVDKIRKMARRGASAVVVGGGITALELVEGLHDLGMKVHYILRGDRYWSNLLSETESRIVEHRLMEEGVKIHFNAQLAEINGHKGNLTAVRLQDGSSIPCSILAVAIGIRPRKELAARCGLETKRGIIVGQYMQTSAADVFAAGDVAELVSPEHPDGLLESLWGPALRQGRIAGLNMAGITSPFVRPIPVNVTRLAGLVTTIIGQLGQDKEKSREKDKDRAAITRGESERWIQIPEATEVEDLRGENHLRIYIGNNRIRGALVMGDQTLSRPLQNLVEQQGNLTSVNELLAQLKAPGAQIPNLLYNFWQRTIQQNAYSLA